MSLGTQVCLQILGGMAGIGLFVLLVYMGWWKP